MSLRRFTILGIGLISAALLTSCAGPGTSLTTSWSDPGSADKKIGKLLVIGVGKNPTVRRQYEDAWIRRMATAKITAMSSYMALPDAEAINEASVTPLVQPNALTHILVTRLIDRKTVTSYVPGSTYVVGMPSYYPSYYGSWGGYYGSSYSAVSTPGYTYDTEYVHLETNVYNVTSGKLIWSGITETEMGGQMDTNISNFIEVIVVAMKKDGLL